MAVQTIRHGGKISAATPEEVSNIFARERAERVTQAYHREKGIVQLDATGAGSKSIDVSAQYDWIMERVTVSTNPAAGALIGIYENQIQNSDLLEIIQLGTAGLYSDGFDNRLWVPANSVLVVSVTSGAANGQAAYNWQIKLVPATKQSGLRRSAAR